MLRPDVKALFTGVVMAVAGLALGEYYIELTAVPYSVITTWDLAVAILALVLLLVGGAIVLGSVIHWLRELFRRGPYEKAPYGDDYVGD